MVQIVGRLSSSYRRTPAGTSLALHHWLANWYTSQLAKSLEPAMNTPIRLLRFQVKCVCVALGAVLFEFHLPLYLGFARGSVITSSANRAHQRHLDTFAAQSRILVMMPAPTVRPPSRMAKRICSSRPTGVMSSMFMVMLSPGITILTPSGNMQVPVTSVVRM